MKKTLQSSLRSRVRIAWQCVGLLVLFAGVATAQKDSLPSDQRQSVSPSKPPTPYSETSLYTRPTQADPRSRTALGATGYYDPAAASQQVQLEVLFAAVPDEVLMKWAIPHKAIIKRVASNESRPAPLKKALPAASRQFSMLFGSEVPVPLLFDAELRESLLTALKKDTRTIWLRGTSVTTAWAREVRLKTPFGVKEKTPLALRMLPTEIGKGELGLVIDAEVPSTPDVTGGTKSHWNLRARAGHTLMLPLAQPDLENQLVLFVVPKIVEVRPAQYSATPIARPHSLRDYPPEYRPVPQPSYAPVPATAYPPVKQTSYQPVPQAKALRSNQQMVAISADFVIGPASVIPDKYTELNIEQRKAWLKSLIESDASHREQISTVTPWGEATRLTTPRAKGHEAPFDLLVTPTRGGDGAIHLDLKGTISNLRPEVKQKSGFETTLETPPGTTVLLPLPVTQPDGLRVALLIQPQLVAPAPPRQAPPRSAAPAEEEDVATFQMLILEVDAKAAREVVSVTPKNDEQVDDVDVPLPPEENSEKRVRTPKAELRTFTMNASLGKLFIADLKKQDDSFTVISRPQIRTIVGVAAALDIQGGDGSLKLHVTPKRNGEELMINSHLTLIGRGNSLPHEEKISGLKIEASSSQKCQPGTTAVMMLAGKDSGRTIIVLTDLVHLEQVRRSEPPVAQVLPTPAVDPVPTRTSDPRYVMQHSPNSVDQRGPAVFDAAPAKPTNMRLVQLTVMLSSDVSPGDIVDVLLFSTEYGPPEKRKVETLFESLTVFESAQAVDGECTYVKLLVDKEIAADLLLAGDKGMLQLSVHRSPIQRNALPAFPGYSTPASPARERMVYQANGTWGQPDALTQASGVQVPLRPTPVTRRPKSEVQQVLEEVREMRKAIQGLREDMNQLRSSVLGAQPETAQQTDIWIPKGSSRTLMREKRIARVEGFDTDIVGVHAKSANSVVVFGLRPGRTTVNLNFEGEGTSAEKIVVAVVAERPVGNLTPLIPRPKAADHLPPLPGTRPSPPMPVAQPQGPRTELRMLVGHVRVMKRDRNVERIAVGSPSIVEVTQYSPQEYGITGLKPGVTNIVVWYEGETELPITVDVEVLPTQPSANADPFSSTGSPESDIARRQIEQALKKPVSIEMADGTLQEAIAQLRKTAGINIVIDAAALEDEGVTTDVKVSLHLSGVSLRSALKNLLSPFNLATLVEDEVLKVTSQLQAKGGMLAVAYQVVDFVQTDKNGQADFDSLIELITSVVEPDSWQEVGGVGAIAPNAHTRTLVVRQTQDVHEEIQQLFAALRKWNPGDQPATSAREAKFEPDQLDLSPLQATPESPKLIRNDAIPHPAENPLDRVISVTFDEVPLEDVLRLVATAVDVQLSIDQDALDAEGVKKKVPVSLNVERVRANSVLKLFLKPMKLAAVLEDGKTLKVTSLLMVKERQSVRVYSVSHLVDDPEVIDMKKLIDMITSSVDPTSWQMVGGAGTIAPNEKTQSLVIRQTVAAHKEIADFLEQLANRQIKPGDETQTEPPGTSNPRTPAEPLPEKPPGDTGAPIDVPRRR